MSRAYQTLPSSARDLTHARGVANLNSMKLTLFLALLPSIGLAACPDLPERSDRHSELLKLLASAPNQPAAEPLNRELWGIWTTAPDATAQEMLDSGMNRRGSYDYLGALEDFDRLVAYCPAYAEGYNQRAFIHYLREDYAASLEDLDATLAIMPDHVGALSGKALALFKLGRDRQGQLALRQALAFNPWLNERFLLKPLEEEPTRDREL